MGSALVYVVVVAVVAGVVFLLSALVFGRGEELAPMPPTATPTRLPARDLAGDDVRQLRFQQTLRGYKCSEVDWALARLATEVDTLRARLDAAEGPAGAADPDQPGHPERPDPERPDLVSGPVRTNGPGRHAADPSADLAAGSPADSETTDQVPVDSMASANADAPVATGGASRRSPWGMLGRGAGTRRRE